MKTTRMTCLGALALAAFLPMLGSAAPAVKRPDGKMAAKQKVTIPKRLHRKAKADMKHGLKFAPGKPQNGQKNKAYQVTSGPKGSWTQLVNVPPTDLGVGNQLLMTDGSVVFIEADFHLVEPGIGSGLSTGRVFKLTPDKYGRYETGTWSEIASLPQIEAEVTASIADNVLTIINPNITAKGILSAVNGIDPIGPYVNGPGVNPNTLIQGNLSSDPATGSGTYQVAPTPDVDLTVLTISVQYAPISFGSAILPDGRLVFVGGENNGSLDDFIFEEPGSGYCWQSNGAVYDPVADNWTAIDPPDFFTIRSLGPPPAAGIPSAGDSATVVLSDGTYMISNSLSQQHALLNPNSLTWIETGTSTKFDNNNEEGLTLLPSGKVLAVDDGWVAEVTTNVPGFEPFLALVSGNTTFFSDFTYPIIAEAVLATPDINGCTIDSSVAGKIVISVLGQNCGNLGIADAVAAAGGVASIVVSPVGGAFSPGSYGATIFNAEVGPEVGNALIAAIQNVPGGVVLGISSPLAGNNSELYDPETGTWTSIGNTNVNLIDPFTFEVGPGLLMADGTVFYATGDQTTATAGTNAIFNTATNSWSVGPRFPIAPEGQLTAGDLPAVLLPNGNAFIETAPGFYNPPLYFFEFDGQNLIDEPTLVGNPDVPFGSMVLLPTGQILAATYSTDVEIYTPADRSYKKKWAPKICEVERTLHAGKTYSISGIRFNGMSQAQAVGDEDQAATNFPLVRITNHKTKHVRYARTHDFSFMGVASDMKVTALFDLPDDIELGCSSLEVVANGIPSKAVNVKIHD
ncbi:MAG: hypothetical protein JSS12_02670 [Verrucomicrobia bacterium]|nr:hypothetical protein [Verrucomicrobiota bacterium]